MRFGIFGGTFDPFTPAHRAIVKELLNMKDSNGGVFFNKVWIAPTVVTYHRGDKSQWLEYSQKKEVIGEMLSDLRYGIDYEIWEVDERRKSFCRSIETKDRFVNDRRFIDTLLDFKAAVCKDKDDEVYVVIGSDSLKNFKTWFMWEEILRQAKLIVVPGRNGVSDMPAIGFPYTSLYIQKDLEDCSATKYRKIFRFHPASYEAYIAEVCRPTVKGEKRLLKTPIFEVIEGKPVDGPGSLKPVLINAPDWVTIIAEKGGKLLVEKQFRYGSNCEVEEFPCGMVEKSESASDAAARELEEETGYKISAQALMHLGSVNPNPAFMTNMMHYFYVDLDHADYEMVSQRLDEHEKITFSWKDKDKFIAETLKKISSRIQVPAMLLTAFKLYDEKVKHNDESIEILFDEANAESEENNIADCQEA